MRKIEAYVTSDNTLFRIEQEARDHETKKRLITNLHGAMGFLECGEDLFNFIRLHRDIVLEVLAATQGNK